MANQPNLPLIQSFLDTLFAKVVKVVQDSHAAVDAVAPGAADDIYAGIYAKLSAIKAELDPAQIAKISAEELIDLARTLQSPIKQPPTNLAG